jgi:glycosyltransferase involved in cell wall biosynthesis
MIKVGIDLLWVRPGINGGTESYVRNLLSGFTEFAPTNITFVLFVSKDNYMTFQKYLRYPFFKSYICPVRSKNIWTRILWENIFFDRIAHREKIDVIFIPVYSKPYSFNHIPYVVTIHDLQAKHFPEYFSAIKKKWLDFSWKRSLKSSARVISTSHFVKNDIVNLYPGFERKIEVIYIPIITRMTCGDFSYLSQKYNIKSKKYIYSVSSMLPHKNLEVLLKLVADLKINIVADVPSKLVITGGGSALEQSLIEKINALNLNENIILTGLINEEERNCLYKNAFAFLFPSIFEGFGMPPVEALLMGTPVITTKCASIPEITQGKAIYIQDPYDPLEWKMALLKLKDMSWIPLNKSDFSIEIIVRKYIKLFEEISFEGKE